MTGICGWIQKNPVSTEAQQLLSTLLKPIRRDFRIEPIKILTEYCAMAAIDHSASLHGAVHQDGLCVAFQGRVRWRDSVGGSRSGRLATGHVILDTYRRKGPAFLQDMAGPFALCLVDAARDRAFLAVDRLGICPLSYAVYGDRLVFGSDARCIALHPLARDVLSPQSLFNYVYFHMVPSPASIYADQEKLLPGQCVEFNHGVISKHFYWQPDYRLASGDSFSKLKRTFIEKLEHSVASTISDDKGGAFLSGGTDSSTVAGMLRKVKGTCVNTYSIGFEAEGYDETEYARIAARHFDTRPHEYYLKPQDVVDAIPLIASAYDEPFGNASAVPAYFCARMAQSDGLDVLLAGDGGDELFAGNARYARQAVFERYQMIPGSLRRGVLEPLIENSHFDGLPLVGKVKSYIRQANIPLPERLEAYNFLNRFPLSDIFTDDFINRIDTDEPLRILKETYDRANADTTLQRMMFLDLKFTLADNDLRKVSRMCELAGIEVRYPLLDEDLVEFSTHIPSSLLLRDQQLRYFFKRSLSDFLPPRILQKSKHGFGLPFGLWMRTHKPLEEITRESLAQLVKRGFIQPQFIQQLLVLHTQHPNYYGVMLWILMMLEQWLQSCDTYRTKAPHVIEP